MYAALGATINVYIPYGGYESLLNRSCANVVATFCSD
jgi:hypothetical protein